jgi:RNA polymerase sigma factor (TIGR02999 family)
LEAIVHSSALGSMSDVTRILAAIDGGDAQASEVLLPLVYDELRKLAAAKLAQEKPGQTLQATALVHEAYLRLVDTDRAQTWDGRGHFFAAAAEAMRRILIEAARRKGRIKRGGRREQLDLDDVDAACSAQPDEMLLIDEALERLAQEDREAADLVKLRYFAGLSVVQAAECLGISRSTAYEHWTYARAWLHAALYGSGSQEPG